MEEIGVEGIYREAVAGSEGRFLRDSRRVKPPSDQVSQGVYTLGVYVPGQTNGQPLISLNRDSTGIAIQQISQFDKMDKS